MNWTYNNEIITANTIPVVAVGFIYKIEHIPSGKFYIGKKLLKSVRNKKLGVKELALIKAEHRPGRLPSKKQVITDSDWESYYSSNEWIQNEAKLNSADFKRIIIQFCYSKKSLSYYEVYHQFKFDVLTDENSLNGNIGGTYYRKDI